MIAFETLRETHFPMHVSITNQALGNDTSFPGLGLNVAGVDFLSGLQDPENSYMHAMRDGTTNQSVAAAQALYDQYITANCNMHATWGRPGFTCGRGRSSRRPCRISALDGRSPE